MSDSTRVSLGKEKTESLKHAWKGAEAAGRMEYAEQLTHLFDKHPLLPAYNPAVPWERQPASELTPTTPTCSRFSGQRLPGPVLGTLLSASYVHPDPPG